MQADKDAGGVVRRGRGQFVVPVGAVLILHHRGKVGLKSLRLWLGGAGGAAVGGVAGIAAGTAAAAPKETVVPVQIHPPIGGVTAAIVIVHILAPVPRGILLVHPVAVGVLHHQYVGHVPVYQPSDIGVHPVPALPVVPFGQVLDVADDQFGDGYLAGVDGAKEIEGGLVGNVAIGRVLVGDAQHPDVAVVAAVEALPGIANVVQFGYVRVGGVDVLQEIHNVPVVVVGIVVVEIIVAGVEGGLDTQQLGLGRVYLGAVAQVLEPLELVWGDDGDGIAQVGVGFPDVQLGGRLVQLLLVCEIEADHDWFCGRGGRGVDSGKGCCQGPGYEEQQQGQETCHSFLHNYLQRIDFLEWGIVGLSRREGSRSL